MIQSKPEYCEVLASIFATGKVEKPNGELINVKANISPEYSKALFDFVKREKPNVIIEIGMAYGVSTLTILSALDAVGHGRLISIDPYINWRTAMEVALHQVAKAGFADRHTHMHEPSQTALAKLWESGLKSELIYIDGYHNVEYVMTDCFFADRIVPKGGVLAFNDCGWRAVFKVLKFLQRHRRYEELPVLPKTYRSRNLLFSLLRRIEGRCGNDRYFRKLEDWEPESGFYRDF